MITDKEIIIGQSKEIADLLIERELAFKQGKEQERKRILEIIQEMPNPYPTDIFPELTETMLNNIKEVLSKKFLAFPFDRISANLMRRARNTLLDDLKQQIEEKKE
jgi:hypothetical protein